MATGYWVRTIVLLNAQVTSGSGGWVLVGRLLSPTVTIVGLEAGGHVSIRVSNEPEPADGGIEPTTLLPNNYAGAPHAVLGDVTSDIGAGLGGAFTWVRAVKTAGESPTATTVMMQAQIAK